MGREVRKLAGEFMPYTTEPNQGLAPHHRLSPAGTAFFLRRRKHIVRIMRLSEDAGVYPEEVPAGIWAEAGTAAIGEMLAELLGEKFPEDAA